MPEETIEQLRARLALREAEIAELKRAQTEHAEDDEEVQWRAQHIGLEKARLVVRHQREWDAHPSHPANRAKAEAEAKAKAEAEAAKETAPAPAAPAAPEKKGKK
jgi:hypothetical protein